MKDKLELLELGDVIASTRDQGGPSFDPEEPEVGQP